MYEKWVETYNEYLEYMYHNILSKYINVSQQQITYDDFCKFMYEHSSGYISSYI
jgi:hypothetical protein